MTWFWICLKWAKRLWPLIALCIALACIWGYGRHQCKACYSKAQAEAIALRKQALDEQAARDRVQRQKDQDADRDLAVTIENILAVDIQQPSVTLEYREVDNAVDNTCPQPVLSAEWVRIYNAAARNP